MTPDQAYLVIATAAAVISLALWLARVEYHYPNRVARRMAQAAVVSLVVSVVAICWLRVDQVRECWRAGADFDALSWSGCER